MHPLQAVSVPNALQVLPGLEDETSGVLNPNPDGVAPGGNRLFVPVVRSDGGHHSCVIDELRVILDGDEVGVRPLLIEEAKVYGCGGSDMDKSVR